MKKKCLPWGLFLVVALFLCSCASQGKSSSYKKSGNACPAYGKSSTTYERLPY